MNIGNNILDFWGSSGESMLSFSLLTLFKIPFFFLILGNILLVILLYLRVKILADTFSSPAGKPIKLLLKAYIVTTIIVSLIAVLLIILA
ncbi:MAG: hypothetical protein PHP96_02465 [Candidatus Dojkabacteria bacterium]|nr:hypothetical protein [Candidatus Dojkabacteria bacterium]MDD4561225.1 hypothetical protein [Candidatus Dojkabacteria bacterium]NLB12048.1 hypothetical protein [Candidatus Dojkabacteria bacterium]